MKTLYLFMIFILSASLVSAFDFEASLDRDIIVRDFGNSLDLNVEISGAESGDYNLYTLADMTIEPSSVFRVGESDFEKSFVLSPMNSLDVEGYYTFTVTLNHRGFEKVDKKINVNLVNLEDILIIDSNSIDIEDGRVSVMVTNTADVELKNVSARFKSLLFDFEKTFDIKPNSILEIPVEVDVDRLRRITAGIYIINSEFQTEKGIKEVSGKLYLGEKKGITVQEDSSGLIIRSQIISKINSGNVPEDVEISIRRGIISRLFTSFSSEPNIVERNGLSVEYVWIKSRLGPAEVFSVKAKTNYLLPLAIVVLAVVFIFGFKRFMETKVEIKKSVHHIKTKNGEFALKVNLSVRAKSDLENLSLVDRVPSIVKVYKKFGTVKPDEIDTATRRIKWNVGDLKMGEERVFSYVVYSKVGVLGKFSMPAATAIFEKDEKILEVESNRVFFLSDQTRKG